MAHTRRTQILMEPSEFRRLRALARQRKTSVANLIRHAVRQAYLEQPEPVDRNAIVEEMLSLQLPLVEWDEAEKIVEDAHADVC